MSRVFSKFQDEGLISVQQKHIRIIDIPRLKQIFGQRPLLTKKKTPGPTPDGRRSRP